MDIHTRAFSAQTRWLDAAAACTLVGLCAAVLLGKPGYAAWLPPCPLHALTGFYCPGCGSTRALYYLLHAQLSAAFGENALAVLLLPFIVYELFALLTHRLPTMSARLRPWSVWTLLIITLLFAVLRNLPLFHGLAPVDIS